ncbi:MAG: hypothetical protein ACR2NL_10085, partial [Acidimicrobiia bacterium]
VAVGSQLGGLGGSDDAAATTVAAEAAAATPTTAAGGDVAFSDGSSNSLISSAGDGGTDSGGDGAATEDSDLGFADELLEAPALRETQDKSDLQEVTAWLLDARRDTRLLEPVEDVTALPCYDIAVEDDDLDIADGFLVPYVDATGMTLQGIAYADSGTETVEPLIRVYDYLTCEPVVASTD